MGQDFWLGQSIVVLSTNQLVISNYPYLKRGKLGLSFVYAQTGVAINKLLTAEL